MKTLILFWLLAQTSFSGILAGRNPKNLVFTKVAVTNGPGVLLMWEPSTFKTIKNYNVYRGLASGKEAKIASIAPKNLTCPAVIVPGEPMPAGELCWLNKVSVKKTTDFYYYVTTVADSTVESKPSNEIFISVPPTATSNAFVRALKKVKLL